MIALAISALIALYLLIPNALFRFVLSFSVPLKIFQERKTEDLTRAVFTLALIFVIALLAVWYCPFLNSHPFGFSDTQNLRMSDYKIAASGLYNDAMFKDYGDRFWEAFARNIKRQLHFATWYYSFLVMFAIAAGLASRKYGKLRQFKMYSLFADIYLLPHISQWYVLLTPFTFADKRTIVKADALMTDDTLYRGDVGDHFLDKEGNLAGLFLSNPTRFDRRTYLKEKDAWGITRPLSFYWRPIPSAKLYLVADKIVNLNLNYEPTTPSAHILAKYLTKLQHRPISVKITVT